MCHEVSRGDILGRYWDKNPKTFASMLFTVTSTRGFYSPLLYFFLDLRFLYNNAEIGWGLGFVYIFSLFSFESSIVLSLITLYFIYEYIETTIRNASTGGKPDIKPYHYYGLKYRYKTIIEETQVCS